MLSNCRTNQELEERTLAERKGDVLHGKQEMIWPKHPHDNCLVATVEAVKLPAVNPGDLESRPNQ